MSYFVKYWSKDNKPLIGGVLCSQTSLFQRKTDAETRLQWIIEIHSTREVGYEIIESPEPPEIFHHCANSLATCVGCICNGCGKVVTEQDAKEAR